MKAEPFAKAVRDVELIFNDLEAQKSVSAQWLISPWFFYSLGNLCGRFQEEKWLHDETPIFLFKELNPGGPLPCPSNSHNTFWVWDPRLNLQSPAFMRHPSIHPFPKKKWKRKSKKKSLDRIPGHHRYQQWYQHWIGSKAQTCHESTAPFV